MLEAILLIPGWALILVGILFIGLFFLTEYEKPGYATIAVAATLVVLQFGAGVDIFGALWRNPLWALPGIVVWFAAGCAWALYRWRRFLKDRKREFIEGKREFLLSKDLEGVTIPEELREAFLAEMFPNVYHTALERFREAFPKYRDAVDALRFRSTGGPTSDEIFSEVAKEFGVEAPALKAWVSLNSKQSEPVYVLDCEDLPDELKDRFRRILNGPNVKGALIPSAQDHKGRITMWMVWWPWSASWYLLNNPIRRAWRRIWHWLKNVFQNMADREFADIDDDLVSTSAPSKADES